MVLRMSGGPIHIGISDESPPARIRPEARAFASKHSGEDMSSIFKMTNQELDHYCVFNSLLCIQKSACLIKISIFT